MLGQADSHFGNSWQLDYFFFASFDRVHFKKPGHRLLTGL
jgi:hypothetical protein